MPIHCLNSNGENYSSRSNIQPTNKKPHLIIQELFGAGIGPYMNQNSSSQLSHSSTSSSLSQVTIHQSHPNHHLNNLKSKSTSSSLIMAINRFKNSVKNMKETVLIPTRLSDLTTTNNNHGEYEELGEEIVADSEVDSLITDSPPISGYCTGFGNNNNNVDLNSKQQCVQTTEIALNQNQNLYEQFKLLDLIDKILSSDSILAVSIQATRWNGLVENNDNNNNPRRLRLGTENGIHTGLENEPPFKDESYNNNNNIIINTNNNNHHHHQYNNNNNLEGKQQQKQIINRQWSLSNNSIDHIDHIDQGQPMNSSIVSDCSLLKIKEKLEYHLISLQSILNMMSDGAEYITRTYLEDIQSGEDRFDKRRTNHFNDPTESISARHYYTSN